MDSFATGIRVPEESLMSFMARKSTNSNVNEIKTNGHSIVDSTQELAETFNYHFGECRVKVSQPHTQW